ncbi:MAG TPA: FliM/FliN family flagellar motor switch protein [Burkholderiaceae bacterium]|nr:FliM/FliN family flagellar motor switch protein [Burkholderiaceae bacterium]
MSNTSSNQQEINGMVQEIEFSEIQAQTPVCPNVIVGNLALLNGLKVTLSVVVGDVTTTLGELLNLKESSVLKIDRQVDYPVDVTVNGSVVARGQLVVVDDNFGVRVTEVAAAAQS